MTTMRDLINIIEARQTDNPDFEYELTGTTKGKTAAGDYSKIRATVKGKSSAALTRLAKKFNEINELNKQIDELRNEANQEAKDQIESVFDAEDEAYTRYIDTVSLSIMMSKNIEQSEVTQVDVDRVAFINELFDVVDGELLPVIRNLLEKHTTIQTKIMPAQQGRLKVTIPEGMLTEGVWDAIKNIVGKLYKSTMRKLSRYDNKVADIKTRFLGST